MKKISFNEFKNATRYLPVVYTNTNEFGRIKSWEHKKFYCNKDYKSKMIWCPHFGMVLENEFFKLDDKTFLAKSENGETKFEIMEVE